MKKNLVFVGLFIASVLAVSFVIAGVPFGGDFVKGGQRDINTTDNSTAPSGNNTVNQTFTGHTHVSDFSMVLGNFTVLGNVTNPYLPGESLLWVGEAECPPWKHAMWGGYSLNRNTTYPAGVLVEEEK